MSARQADAALTLVEILVAVALGMVITGLTWTAFLQAKASAARGSARVGLHQGAAGILDILKRDFGNMSPALAMFARSTPTTTGTTRSERIEIVFMRSTAPLDKQAGQSKYDRYLADHHWVRWLFTRDLVQAGGVWKVDSAILKRSSSTPIRTFTTTSALRPPMAVVDPDTGRGKADYNGVLWLNLPRPLRDAGGGIASLDSNRYGVPPGAIWQYSDSGDIGDLADLIANEKIISRQVQDFQIGWVDAGGRQVTIDGRTAGTYDLNGLHLDVVGPDNGRYLDRRQDPRAAPGPALDPTAPQYDYRADLARRPRLIRMALRMEDGPAHVDQVFSWSIPTPGFMPQMAPSSP